MLVSSLSSHQTLIFIFIISPFQSPHAFGVKHCCKLHTAVFLLFGAVRRDQLNVYLSGSPWCEAILFFVFIRCFFSPHPLLFLSFRRKSIAFLPSFCERSSGILERRTFLLLLGLERVFEEEMPLTTPTQLNSSHCKTINSLFTLL